ncbi:30S ribosomal protein S6 [Candidatus Roizmanbacteria bacterium RIFOXYB2_FULL_38_10]|uniref:Small ribosomal subunit protein bS6 n=1 Tax=Candidatus Roizmanbacteria bacterium RIFOXYD1_FULL_38_12 TaxID=1802093 RepID=A0A1F7L1R6_9BACT|nr:MAG: 30S ribosomal protein S6 [Candidatus Roizmanbacteria bacterium RIFOXYA2_FULL_38_14]OGK64087.1 MAG: 30S ribosomal protein S6 [Candidatus Roizmanbacteria bacterium RIFOXYA1_FULL_37_12]OGK65933.1 MAG: 30S ribosomal protein S6 [Candidatus Roizmanbacteria bacterium RIFOXYB1_FULL_40_23]OGK67345.1 MAG: 30S ribosomal protein S6 [Candidatus Roizmanbacteria bacterium RIFOXYB2_FULL_38_10]OGK70338.1 MAG: 30S ribosomal protein S6 [Candidatus Roizmanbacteria bacterium RIFOXYC1_FULL_38_14]OGK72177.1 
MTYEFTFLLNEEKELSVIKELIVAQGGKVNEESAWGKKSLIYPIKKHYSASFYHWKLDIKKTKVAELRKKLNYNEKLIRYLLLVSE